MLEHEKWIELAIKDLQVARLTLKNGFFGHVSFNCQQAAEKALKGYLASRRRPIAKTHDLIQLLELCGLFDNEFGKLRPAVVYINPFATKFRYPTEHDQLDQEGAELSVRYAGSIVRFARKKIEQPESGQKNIFL